MVVLVGEFGDTDYEGLVGGVHKTVILKGVGVEARKLHCSRSYPLEDVVPYDSPNVVRSEDLDVESIQESLEKIGLVNKVSL